METTKVTMNFRPDSIEKLGTIAQQLRRSNKTDANAYAIDITSYLATQIAEGQTIILRAKDGKEKELVLPR